MNLLEKDNPIQQKNKKVMEKHINLGEVEVGAIVEVLKKAGCVIKSVDEQEGVIECRRAYGLNREKVFVEIDAKGKVVTLHTEYKATLSQLSNSLLNINEPDYQHVKPKLSGHAAGRVQRGAWIFIGVVVALGLIYLFIRFVINADGPAPDQSTSSSVASEARAESATTQPKPAPSSDYAYEVQSQCHSMRMTVGHIMDMCVSGRYDRRSEGFIENLMMNGQYDFNRDFRNGRCLAQITVDGIVRGSSYQKTITCDMTPYILYQLENN